MRFGLGYFKAIRNFIMALVLMIVLIAIGVLFNTIYLNVSVLDSFLWTLARLTTVGSFEIINSELTFFRDKVDSGTFDKFELPSR